MSDDPWKEVPPTLPIEAYRSAIEEYRACRRELSEVELQIDVARIERDTSTLRKALSKKNRLIDHTQLARERISRAAVEVARFNGMQAKEEPGTEKEPGLLRSIVNKILQS